MTTKQLTSLIEKKNESLSEEMGKQQEEMQHLQRKIQYLEYVEKDQNRVILRLKEEQNHLHFQITKLERDNRTKEKTLHNTKNMMGFSARRDRLT